MLLPGRERDEIRNLAVYYQRRPALDHDHDNFDSSIVPIRLLPPPAPSYLCPIVGANDTH